MHERYRLDIHSPTDSVYYTSGISLFVGRGKVFNRAPVFSFSGLNFGGGDGDYGDDDNDDDDDHDGGGHTWPSICTHHMPFTLRNDSTNGTVPLSPVPCRKSLEGIIRNGDLPIAFSQWLDQRVLRRVSTYMGQNVGAERTHFRIY